MDTFADAGGGQATATGSAGTSPGDDPTVTVVLCSANSFPCATGSTKSTLIAPVNASTHAWSTRSPNLRTCVLLVCTGPGALWAQATQGDAAGNLGATPSRSAIVL
jgi:hypothetical protein